MSDAEPARSLRPEHETGPSRHHAQSPIELSSDHSLTQLRAELAASQYQATIAGRQNQKLVSTLQQARDQIANLKDELDRLAQPPKSCGTIVELEKNNVAVIVVAGRKLRCAVGDHILEGELVPGREVILNEAMNVVEVRGFEQVGEVVCLKEVLSNNRVLVSNQSNESKVAWITQNLDITQAQLGDLLLYEPKSQFVYERLPHSDVAELVLEEVPDISYSDIGGLGEQIAAIRDAIELPFLQPQLYADYELRPPKGILLYGPPGCGKTLIAKAVAASLARNLAARSGNTSGKAYFLNVKGPELLNKYVGETERHIRLIFQRARAKGIAGMPVVIFFDEMDSLFRTRGSGVSSDVETTIVPQLLAEIDGVERLENVIVIGASNREDMIDPAILRPGRLDVKIKIQRPNAEAAREIFAKYLTDKIPYYLNSKLENNNSIQEQIAYLIDQTVAHMYAEVDQNRFLEVTYANSDTEILYFKDFNSGAMIENIVNRAKKSAIKTFLHTGEEGIKLEHLLDACITEFRENEDLPNTTNPDDWARISGKKGERISYIKTLVGSSGQKTTKNIALVPPTGQYL